MKKALPTGTPVTVIVRTPKNIEAMRREMAGVISMCHKEQGGEALSQRILDVLGITEEEQTDV